MQGVKKRNEEKKNRSCLSCAHGSGELRPKPALSGQGRHRLNVTEKLLLPKKEFSIDLLQADILLGKTRKMSVVFRRHEFK